MSTEVELENCLILVYEEKISSAKKPGADSPKPSRKARQARY